MRKHEVDLCPGHTISLWHFRNVTNASTLCSDVIAQKVHAAVVNAQMIVSEHQVLVAATKASVAQGRGDMKTHGVHTELLYCMSGSRNIKDSLNKFGVQDSTTSVLVAVFDATPEQESQVPKWVVGEEATLEAVADNCDSDAIVKAFKVSPQELQLAGGLEMAVVSRMASSEC